MGSAVDRNPQTEKQMQLVHMAIGSIAIPTYSVDDFGTLLQITSFEPQDIGSLGTEVQVDFSVFAHTVRESQYEGE
jgi:hypothetical protein